ncbi:hypothetical protein QW180_27080 [Vibrio sinaloensis]|nr:hypothetical protein [Vibrio sinaloensis]
MLCKTQRCFRPQSQKNISVVVPDASQEQIVAAAKVANIDDYIQSLPKGYQTEIGERGVTLSSGQKNSELQLPAPH